MGCLKWYLFLIAVQNLWSSNREDTGRSPAPVGDAGEEIVSCNTNQGGDSCFTNY